MLGRFLKKFGKQESPGDLLDDYVPSEEEEFMSARQLAFFKRSLEAWREDILNGTAETIEHLQTDEKHFPDITDRASHESERALELRTRDRQRKLIPKIEDALRRIDSGHYGYCEKTGEPIAIKRLIARPIATLSIEAQEMHEREEKIYHDK